MEAKHLDYLLTDDPARVDFAAVYSWLTDSYWSPGISREKCEQAARHSTLVISAFHQSKHVGYCRVVSDRTRFAWLADVYVHPDHRGRGLGRVIVKFALDHPSVTDVSKWMLETKDAHGVYAALGFAPAGARAAHATFARAEMSKIIFRLATTSDVESLTTMRLAFLAEILPDRKPGPELRDAMSRFFTDALSTGEFVAYLAVADSKVIASSGLAFHRHPPSIANPTGREAYIMNMYTLPEFRRRGIATELLSLLVDHARENHCGKVSLHAMANGRSIYVKAGFIAIETEMRLNISK